MTFSRKKFWTILLPITGICIIWMIRFFPAGGEFYARKIYPLAATFLSGFSSFVPFSLGDCFILLALLGIIYYFIKTLCKKQKRGKYLFRIFLFLSWIYIWFYFAWGLNYFRENFYTRAKIVPIAYTEANFRDFLRGYIEQLNRNYVPIYRIDSLPIAEEIRKGYVSLSDTFGLVSPPKRLKAKNMLFSSLFSKVGVTGYMGPFFAEFNLNRELRPEEYPAVYAHETAHRLGISSEAEANFYAWLVCSRSRIPEIRHSGNFLLLGYVLSNASRLLPEEEFKTFVASIRPEILEQYKSYQQYWRNKYSPGIGKLQNYIYNLFLQSNQIPSGTKNYSEVIGLVISWQNRKPPSKT